MELVVVGVAVLVAFGAYLLVRGDWRGLLLMAAGLLLGYWLGGA